METGVTEHKMYGGKFSLYFEPVKHIYYTFDVNGDKYEVPGVTSIGDVLDKSGPLTAWAAKMVTVGLEQRLAGGWVVDGKLAIPYNTFQALLLEAKSHFRDIQEEALDIGSIAHDWLEKYQKYWIRFGFAPSSAVLPPPQNEKARNCVEAALEWFSRHQVTFLDTERKVLSVEHMYCGTMDARWRYDSCGDPACCVFAGPVAAVVDLKSSKRIYEEYRLQTAAYTKGFEEEFPDSYHNGRLIMRLDKEGDGVETAYYPRVDLEPDFAAFLSAQDLFSWRRQFQYDKAEVRAAVKAAKPVKAKKPRKLKISSYVPIPMEV